MLRFLILALLPIISLATDGWRPCDNGEPMPNLVQVQDCALAPCILPRGRSIIALTDFTNPDYSEGLTIRTRWREIASGITGEFPFPSEIKNACRNLVGTECPVYPTEDVQHNLTMPVLRIYPPNLDLDLEMSLWNDLNEPVYCFNILARTSST